MKKLFSFILVICTFALLLCAVSPTLAAASLDENKNLPKTGTTYETATITFMYRSEGDATRDFEIVKSEIPEFKDIVKSREPLVAKGELEVRYASLFSVSQEEVREYGYKKYQGVINNLVSLTKKQGIMLSPDLDDLKLQAFAKQQFLSTEDAAVISFVKFIDIYENYAYNNEMRKLVIEPEGKVFKSIDELMSNESLSTLLNMMPVTIRGTAEHGTDEENDKNSETGLPGYNANNAVSYASSWWKKTNNTTYGYYARYNNHPDPTNNNMWSGGTGNNKRTWADCANFVSQCLAADGAQKIKKGLILPHTKTGNWYYNDSRPSHTWGGAGNFFNHWSDRVGTRSSASQTKKGDPFSVDYGGDNIPDHTLIITSVSGTSTSNMKYACHTSDQYEATGKSLSTIYNNCEAVWIYKVG